MKVSEINKIYEFHQYMRTNCYIDYNYSYCNKEWVGLRYQNNKYIIKGIAEFKDFEMFKQAINMRSVWDIKNAGLVDDYEY